MAMEIRPIPVVTGDDAKRFIQKAEQAEKNPHTVKLKISREEFDKMMSKANLSSDRTLHTACSYAGHFCLV
mgnify:CR=1 FL=1